MIFYERKKNHEIMNSGYKKVKHLSMIAWREEVVHIMRKMVMAS